MEDVISTLYRMVIATLATYGLSILFVEYQGYKNLFIKLRGRFEALRCVVCSSVWLAAPIIIFSGLGILEYLAVIGSVIIIDRYTDL